jgi:hypothetical protein
MLQLRDEEIRLKITSFLKDRELNLQNMRILLRVMKLTFLMM